MAEALVEYDYKAQESDELTIKKGDIITNIVFKPGGWWEGTLLNGKRGMFPDNFVKLIKTEDGGVPPPSSGRRCKVLFPYKPEKEDELELQVGDIIEIISEVEEGWWKGSLKNKVGVFPSNFVAEIADSKVREAALRKPKITRDESVKSLSKGMSTSTFSLDSQTSPMSEDKSESTPDIPSLPPKPAKEYCRVLYKYPAANSDELSLSPGDVITIITKEGQDPGWWKGELKGKIGVFPDNFVEVISVEEAQKTELKNKVTNSGSGVAISKSATTSSISDSFKLNFLNRKFSDVKSAEEKIPPSVGKKPVLPPPPNKKPSPTSITTTKIVESGQSGQTSGKVVSTTTIKHGSTVISETSTISSSSSKRSVIESSDAADGIGWSKQSYSLIKNEKSNSEGVTGVHMNSVESGDLNLDMVGRSSKKLVHPTATRAKAPKRRPPSGMYSFSKENGASDGEDEDESGGEEMDKSGGLVNGDTDHHGKDGEPGSKAAAPPPWVEELKLSQAKKLVHQHQVTTQVIRGMSTSSERTSSLTSSTSFHEKSSEHTTAEKVVAAERTEKSLGPGPSVSERVAASEKASSERAAERMAGVSPEGGKSSGTTVILRQQSAGSIGSTPLRPHSMISTLRSPISPSSAESITLPLKQWNDLLDKVATLESNFEKAVKHLTERLDEEVEKRKFIQQELEKLTDLVTQV